MRAAGRSASLLREAGRSEVVDADRCHCPAPPRPLTAVTHAGFVVVSLAKIKNGSRKMSERIVLGETKGPIITSEGLGVGAARGLK